MPSPQALVTIANHLRIGKYVQVAGFVVLIYDHILTFPEEVERTWKRKLTPAAFLFYLNRYITPLQYIVVITAFHHPRWIGKVCEDFVKFEGVMGGLMNNLCGDALCLACTQPFKVKLTTRRFISAVMILRVYALYGRQNLVLYPLSAIWVAHIIITAKANSTGFALPLPPSASFVGCLLTSNSNWYSIVWITPLVLDAAVFLLTVWRIRKYITLTGRKTPMMHIFLRDGILYFFVIFLINLGNALLYFLAPESLKPIGAPLSSMMSATMISRLILNLRAAPTVIGTGISSHTSRRDSIQVSGIVSRAMRKFGQDFESPNDSVGTLVGNHRSRSGAPYPF
ncbi:hypothetical protein NLJ89_g5162 [Agrocybe chaxingu]|uniref:DUF6533 domain-containing protein n=1 Tax=Agrocybe chaxingu TaxID=84603 RepID=A0A9W8K0Q6_9AGAR|nr:hypothetical protein NLJ89_g5162 [Agrocybe chaxingu]